MARQSGDQWTCRTVHEREDATGVKREEEQTLPQAPQAQETCTGKTNPHNIWLKTRRLNFMSSYHQWVLTLGTLKIMGSVLGEWESIGKLNLCH